MTNLLEEPHPDSEEGRMLLLFDAAEAGDLAAVQRLLDLGLSVNAEDSLVRGGLPPHSMAGAGQRWGGSSARLSVHRHATRRAAPNPRWLLCGCWGVLGWLVRATSCAGCFAHRALKSLYPLQPLVGSFIHPT
jgi:hypothetical protein